MRKILLAILLIVLWAAYLGWKANLEPRAETTFKEDTSEEVRELTLSTLPATVIQGDPVLVVIDGIATSTIDSLTFNNKEVGVFTHNSNFAALIGLDLKMTPGTYPLELTLTDGRTIRKELIVGKRVIATAPLGIPDKLGGNTPEGERNVINSLVADTALIANLPTDDRALWSGTFRFPVDPPITITDTYGYSRLTGASTISHKGTDFRATVGTPVYAMNSGKVVFTRLLSTYGNTIVIDHGLGLQTIYMHLSRIDVRLGDTVEKGELIGKSGDTGYVQGAHLHLTVRIGGISIDPMKFMDLFGS